MKFNQQACTEIWHEWFKPGLYLMGLLVVIRGGMAIVLHYS
jgi:hypothetical protein